MARLLGLVFLVLGMAVALHLFTQKAQKDVQSVKNFSLNLPEQVTPAALDWQEANRVAAELESQLGRPAIDYGRLQALTTTVARWVAGSQPGSPEYRLAVALRAACFALSQANGDMGSPQRHEARRHLATARAALAGEASGGAAQSIQDQLTNLQVQHNEQVQEVEKEAP